MQPVTVQHSEEGAKGDRFQFIEGKWSYELEASKLSEPGTYLGTIRSGDEDEYIISPSCTAHFVIE